MKPRYPSPEEADTQEPFNGVERPGKSVPEYFSLVSQRGRKSLHPFRSVHYLSSHRTFAEPFLPYDEEGVGTGTGPLREVSLVRDE